MAITNQQIIFNEQMRLLDAGLISGTGKMITVETADGEMLLPEAEPIHTFQMWKALGFRVKKGEHAVARFSIWKYTGKKADEEVGQDAEKGHCFLKESCFFSLSQVEQIV